MKRIQWIQLSDLHFGDDSPYSKRSRDSLLKFVKSQGKNIDYIFVTGDIIFAKNLRTQKDKLKAYDAAEAYLKEIYTSIWKDDSSYAELYKRMFIVPGNHDLLRNDARTSCIGGLRNAYLREKKGNIDQSYIDNTKAAMKLFSKFYNKITNRKVKNRDNMHYVIETDELNILHINTCISSSSDGDDGALILGFELLNKAIETIQNGKPTIALAHHNFDCLQKEEQRKLELLLKEKNILLYLCGHAHERESNLVLRYNQIKTLNTFTCGALMSEDGENKFLDTVLFRGELNLDTKEGLVRSYKWALGEEWHEDTDFGLVQKNKENYRNFSFKTTFDNQSIPLNIGNDVGVVSKIVSNQSSERNVAFYATNDKAESSLSIYGVGITSVSHNTELFDKILDKGGIVRLCMVDPNIFKVKGCTNGEFKKSDNNECNLEKSNFCIYANHLDQYIRSEYYEDVNRSYKRIIDYKAKAKNKKGEFKIKLLKSFIPISINIINEDMENAELIIEYNMPFTSKRLLLQLSKDKHEEYFMQIKSIFDVIWEKAEGVEDEY